VLSDTDDTTTVAGTEMSAHAPQPVDVPQTQRSSRGGGWFSRGVRGGIIAAVVVVVAGAFFTIGWFTSTRGEQGHPRMMNDIYQKMNMREQGGSQGGTDQRGMNQWPGYPNRGRGMVVPQQGQTQGQTVPIVPTPQSPSNGQSNPQGQSTQQGYLGVGVETVTPALQQQYGLTRSSGVLVASIDGSGPAFKAGIQRGDIITSIDGAPVAQQEDVVGRIAKMKAGNSVSVAVDRNGQSLTFQVTLAGRQASVSG
jgi:membrane-associated protease RseP (regulator of RpoE activity)